MGITTLHCRRAGLQTQVQDLGRPDFRAYGVPLGGAMDRMAAQMANWLVGNPLDGPVLEITLWGPRIEIKGPCQIALTGGDLSPRLDGHHILLYHSLEVGSSTELTFGHARSGCRTYLSVGGEWQVTRWLGSCSAASTMATQLTPESRFDTDARLKINVREAVTRRSLRQYLFQTQARRREPFRVVPGPELHLLPKRVVDHFFGQPLRLSSQSNRMGCRLDIRLPWHPPTAELISSGVVPGTVQLMRSGQPVILMADAPTTGGYPRIGNVITADLDRLAQVLPGGELRFALVDEEAAVRALRRQRQLARELLD